jgi:hypothetical protein
MSASVTVKAYQSLLPSAMNNRGLGFEGGLEDLFIQVRTQVVNRYGLGHYY